MSPSLHGPVYKPRCCSMQHGTAVSWMLRQSHGCRWVLARRCWRSRIPGKGVVEAHFSIWRWSGFALLIPWTSLDCEMLLLHQQRFSGIVIYLPPLKKKTPGIQYCDSSMVSPIITLHSQDFFWQMEYTAYTAWKVLFSHAKLHRL